MSGRSSNSVGLTTLSVTLVVAFTASAARPEDVPRLDAELTPLGAIRAGNADGGIPEWTAGTATAEPDGDDAPLFVVNRANAEAHAAQLTAGERALLDALPESYALPVYASHRTASAPADFLAATRANATQATLPPVDGAPQGWTLGVPFPLLSELAATAGREAIWNHRLRWRGAGRSRTLTQVTSSTQADLNVLRLREKLAFHPATAPDRPPILVHTLRGILEPLRLLGTLKLVRDPLIGPPQAWQRSPRQQFFQATSSAGEDTPLIGAEGLFDEDQQEGFSGSPARYQWKWLGRRELLVPYDATACEGAAPDDIFGPRHLRPGLLRWELHRVQVLEARLKPQLIAPFARRVLYQDEDSWQVLAVDLYDRDDRLVRVQQVHTRVAPDGALVPTLEAVYDLPGKRYFAAAVTNRDGEMSLDGSPAGDFEPGAALRWARRAGIEPPPEPAR